MRHRVKGKKLGRDASHRKALCRNLASSLIEHGEVVTTLAKAKYIRPYVEKLVTKANKKDTMNARRFLRTKLVNDAVVETLINEVAPKFKDRAGGYTRIVRVGNRSGDNSMLARISFVDGSKGKK
ncbi:50S ribosomal protein L17 [candidate division WWE3 bacterium]|nr:50S ribosomal protein L17 [candidate division WWE3 bacterium]